MILLFLSLSVACSIRYGVFIFRLIGFSFYRFILSVKKNVYSVFQNVYAYFHIRVYMGAFLCPRAYLNLTIKKQICTSGSSNSS